MRASGAGQILRERYGNELRHNLIGNAKWQDQTLETGAWAASALIPSTPSALHQPRSCREDRPSAIKQRQLSANNLATIN
jgi:hypothetical protein